MASTLDTSGLWDAGDDLRIIEALMLPFGTYVLDCVGKCCNQLEDMSPEAVIRVKALLDEFDTVSQIETEQNLGDTEGKVLVKADVLEWEVTGNGVAGTTQEKGNLRAEIARYFSFCTCINGYLPGYPGSGGYAGHSSLIRS